MGFTKPESIAFWETSLVSGGLFRLPGVSAAESIISWSQFPFLQSRTVLLNTTDSWQILFFANFAIKFDLISVYSDVNSIWPRKGRNALEWYVLRTSHAERASTWLSFWKNPPKCPPMEVAAEKASDYRIIRDWLNLNRPLRSTADLKWPNTSNRQMAHNRDDRGHLQFQDTLSCALKTPVLSFPALKKSTVDTESGAKYFIRAVYSLELFFVKKCDLGKEHRLSSVSKWVLLPGNTTVFLSPAGCCKSRFANSSGLNAAQNSVREMGSYIVWRCVFCLPNYFPSLEPTETQFSFFKRKAQPAFATTGCDAAKCRRPPLPPCSRLWTQIVLPHWKWVEVVIASAFSATGRTFCGLLYWIYSTLWIFAWNPTAYCSRSSV